MLFAALRAQFVCQESKSKFVNSKNRTKHQNLDLIMQFSRHKKLVNDYLIYYGGKRSDFKRDA